MRAKKWWERKKMVLSLWRGKNVDFKRRLKSNREVNKQKSIFYFFALNLFRFSSCGKKGAIKKVILSNWRCSHIIWKNPAHIDPYFKNRLCIYLDPCCIQKGGSSLEYIEEEGLMKENLVRNAPAAVVDSFDLLSDPDTFLLPSKDWLTAMFMSNTHTQK